MGKHKKHKKEKKPRKHSSSSSSEEWVEAEPFKEKKCKKKHKQSSRKRHSSSEYSDSSSDSEFKKYTSNIDNNEDLKGQQISKREDWMSLSLSFSSVSNLDRRRQREEDKKLMKEKEQYDPRKCSKELNPYWKDGGDGLPKFKKPKYEDSDDNITSRRSNNQSNWRKKKVEEIPNTNTRTEIEKTKEEENTNMKSQTVTNEDLNVIAGKILKAEIMGNEKLVIELKEKLNKARQLLHESKNNENEVLLTQTDRQGRSKPVHLGDNEPSTSRNSKRKTAVDTHHDRQRTKYFPDDDKYSLAQMFENEKFNTAEDQDSEFVKIASNLRKNDDMDDFFTDSVRRKKSDSKIAEANRSKAINEHHKVTESLENCLKCIQSTNMPKNLIISMGEYTYLSLPEYEPLTDGHCLIAPVRHTPSVTQLDENEWSEILDFRKSLVKMFNSRNEDVVFFEIAMGYHRYPHTTVECVPLPKEEGDMAPIYFKKAIDESETEWAQNKKLVSLKGRDVRRAIPKGLPYFSVSFGMEEGYAHVIEDEQLFPKNFAQEIIGGMLDLHHSKWRKPVRQSFQEQSKRVLHFSKEWKDFDCTIKE
ncbi:hypothetical protein GWI33_013345 [Rhynchophorus ferrugineus]|uniref:CWF19-like protein 2 n=1 Tax=Rhynchophorus ferrugineus TaxID=354439 RepID=A0A834I4T1_RHYFE|nr:hypothetical protein GWI33_013345 [Rhynchophorus ferrugineus]